jgi:hypothetical protein
MTAATQPITSTHRYGRELYAAMKSDFDFSQIVWTMLRYNESMGKEEATRLLDAFLQWISLAPLNSRDRFITMFKTPVEEAFHNFVLNTRLYRQFCDQFLPFFFHHDPIVSEAKEDVHEWAKYTVELMEAEFGDDLNPELKRWREQFDAGTYHVACAGPGGHC